MENDTSISRLNSSDTNTPAPRRKSAWEKIEISQLSFFDELLSIGQFKSNIPEAAGLPIEQPDSSDQGPENKPVDETSDEPDSGKQGASTDSTEAQSIESIGPLATSETPPDESFLSVTTLVNSSAPTTNFLAQNAAPVSTSHNLTSTNANARPSVEGISAVASTTTRGGIQTNSSTTFSGATTTTSNLARTEQVGGEVARSNPGSRISAAGDTLLNNIQTLRDRLAEQGMKVAYFEVEVGTDSSGFDTSGSNFSDDSGTESQSRWDHATSRFAQQNSNRIVSESAQSERKSGAAWTRTNGTLDLTV